MLCAQKWNLIGLHVLLLIGACTVIVLCSLYFDSLRYIGTFNKSVKILVLVISLICTSGLLLLLCTLGIYTIITLKTSSVNWYSVLMTLVLFLKLTGGLLIFAYQDSVSTEVRTEMVRQSRAYSVPGLGSSDEEATLNWDKTQIRFKCCGVNAFKDWRVYRPQLRGTPDSCSCKTIDKTCSQEFGVFNQGCYKQMVEDKKVLLFAAAWIAIGISLLQLCAVRLLENFKRNTNSLDIKNEFSTESTI